MAQRKPPIPVRLSWQGDLRFAAASGAATAVLDADGRAGLSPMQSVAAGFAACMASDVVHILTKARLKPVRVVASLIAHRSDAVPARFERFELHFDIAGDMTPDQIERAIALSRDKYCSVWHSLRPDISLATTFELSSAPGDVSPAADGS